ncbi:MAG: nucleotidyl transferase AbiEii/AbiGii toxin family protein [bacterium]
MATSHGKENWQVKVMPVATRRALDFFASKKWMRASGWYLAGGTALALACGHRRSVDLDFFQAKPFSTDSLLRHLNTDKLWKTEKIEENTVHGSFGGAKISFMTNSSFRPAFSFGEYGMVRILDERDVAATKLISVSQRGKKRDFVDLFWYAKNREPLRTLFNRFAMQYPDVGRNFHHIIKSLVYFEDAERDPMPLVNFAVTWKEIKTSFVKDASELSRDLLGVEL